MTRAAYDVKEEYLGVGSLSAYTFDFKIEAKAQLLVIEIDDTGVETQRVLGTDTTYLSSVTFDAIKGGGTVNLTANLTTNYRLIILLANDLPTQPYEFRDKGAFTMKTIEKALDFITGAIQRLSYRGKQAVRIHDGDDISAFNPQFPPGAALALERYLRVNDAGTGFEYGFTIEELADLVLPDSPLAGQIIIQNAVGEWVNSYFGGGGLTSAVLQSIAGNGQITIGALAQQLLKVQGNAGAQTTSTSPFSTTPADGTILVLKGSHATSFLKIPYADVAGGCMIKGDCYLGLNDTLTLVYDLTADRYIELARAIS